MSMTGLIGESFLQSEIEFHRERAMQQYHRHPRRAHKRHHGAPFTRRSRGERDFSRPAVS